MYTLGDISIDNDTYEIVNYTKENDTTVIVLSKQVDTDVFYRGAFATWMIERQDNWRKLNGVYNN